MARTRIVPLSEETRKKLGGSLIFFGRRPGRSTNESALPAETAKSEDELKSSSENSDLPPDQA
jgi:hypothetical protein